MDNNYTHVSVLVDKSSSMSDITQQTINGFNEFLSQQKAQPGRMTLTLAQFNTSYGPVNYHFSDINSVYPLNKESYQPCGMTALLDAVKTIIDETGKKLAALPEALRPGKVLVLIITDGEENASRFCNVGQMNELIQQQKTVYNWEFQFIGADITQMKAKQAYGDVAVQNSAYINKAKMFDAFELTSGKISKLRAAATMDAGKGSLAYSADEQASLQ